MNIYTITLPPYEEVFAVIEADTCHREQSVTILGIRGAENEIGYTPSVPVAIIPPQAFITIKKKEEPTNE